MNKDFPLNQVKNAFCVVFKPFSCKRIIIFHTLIILVYSKVYVKGCVLIYLFIFNAKISYNLIPIDDSTDVLLGLAPVVVYPRLKKVLLNLN